MAFIPGVTGRLYNQFALTVAIRSESPAFQFADTLVRRFSAAFLRHGRRAISRRSLVQCGFDRLSHDYANWCGCDRMAMGRLGSIRWRSWRNLLSLTAHSVELLPVEDQATSSSSSNFGGASLQRTDAVPKM